MFSMARSTYPEILKKILKPVLELLPFFRKILKILNLKIFSSEMARPIATKFSHNSLWVVHFKKYVQQVLNPSKMAASGVRSLTLDPTGKCI